MQPTTSSPSPQPGHSTDSPDPATPALQVPAGFAPMPPLGPYFQALGPVYLRDGNNGDAIFGLHVDPTHENMQGVAHGGMLATLVDGALGYGIARARGQRLAQVTVSMSLDYLSSARIGEWLEAHVHINRIGQRMAFADCNLRTAERHVVRASAVFAFVERKLPATAFPDQAS